MLWLDVPICSETFKSVCRAPVEIYGAATEWTKVKSEVDFVVTSRDQWLHLTDWKQENKINLHISTFWKTFHSYLLEVIV